MAHVLYARHERGTRVFRCASLELDDIGARLCGPWVNEQRIVRVITWAKPHAYGTLRSLRIETEAQDAHPDSHDAIEFDTLSSR